jgi:hypothetical protein
VEISLSPQSAARVRAVLGDTVDLSPAEVPQVLARLAEEAPDVYSRVLDELSGSDIRLDSERALHRRHRRSLLRRLLLGWAEYESEAGDRLVAKRRVAAAVPIALAAVMLALTGFSALLGRPHRASRPTAVRLVPPAASVAAAHAAVLLRASVRTKIGQRRVIGRAASAPPRSRSSLPPVPPFALPVLPAGRPIGDSPPTPLVFNRVPAADGTGVRRSDAEPRSPVVYARDAGPETTAAGVPSTPGPNRASTSAGAAPSAGDRIPARLVTGIVAASGTPPVPVVATGVNDGSTWLGQAAVQPDGRVTIAFRLADTHETGAGGAAATSGVALDPDHLSAGLPGKVVVRRRAAAAVAMGAVVQAASDYAQALARAGQITITDSAGSLTAADPGPAWTYAASRLGDALGSEAPGATIETVEIPAGTSLVILVTETR